MAMISKRKKTITALRVIAQKAKLAYYNGKYSSSILVRRSDCPLCQIHHKINKDWEPEKDMCLYDCRGCPLSNRRGQPNCMGIYEAISNYWRIRIYPDSYALRRNKNILLEIIYRLNQLDDLLRSDKVKDSDFTKNHYNPPKEVDNLLKHFEKEIRYLVTMDIDELEKLPTPQRILDAKEIIGGKDES